MAFRVEVVWSVPLLLQLSFVVISVQASAGEKMTPPAVFDTGVSTGV